MPILLWFFPYIILSAGYQLALAPRANARDGASRVLKAE
jgi:hypothetical protein